MNAHRLSKIGHVMKQFEYNEKHLVKRIDISKKICPAEESIMNKHCIGENHNDERTWRF